MKLFTEWLGEVKPTATVGGGMEMSFARQLLGDDVYDDLFAKKESDHSVENGDVDEPRSEMITN